MAYICLCVDFYVIILMILLFLYGQVLDTSPELRPVAMETLICMVTQLGQRYKIFIPAVKKVRLSPPRNLTMFSNIINFERYYVHVCLHSVHIRTYVTQHCCNAF